MRRPIAGLTMVLTLTGSHARGEHAKMTLDVESGGKTQTAFVDQTPPESGKNPRPVLKAKAGAPIKILWVVTNAYPHKTLENVVVHAFVARQEMAGQKALPELRDDVVLESAFDMDFKPGAKAGQRLTLKINAPGAYLVRVETKQTGSDHEHFAAIDLVIEAEGL